MTIKLKLEETLSGAGITKNALAREAKVRPNLIYDMCEGKTKRIDLETLGTILDTLNTMTGRSFTLNDIMEYIPAADR
ncbi:MAG: helix-turn-helix transcriptional regulator [Paenibacillus sp.]|uniref:helix-turn-helix domain-containing protein n=1 Tax=Paenibacillus sp. TaxID=58172 RepID=UPI002900FF84|nr:helix-turn-helix transcriptional regulator [Paenibacillus sp.]MDU2239381.1 helix-turn-helix transcriptional regulator [Paenibacillus sp.]